MKLFIVILLTAGLLTACARQQKAVEASLDEPINCATAEGDLRVLEAEKVNAAQRFASGVTAIAPIGLVVGLLTRTEGTKFRVAFGQYNEALDQKIADITAACDI